MRLAAGLGLFVLFGTAARADWVSLTGAENSPTVAEIHVEEHLVRVILEIYASDRWAFRDLLAPAGESGAVAPVAAGALATGFQVMRDDGEALRGRLVIAESRTRIDRASPYRNLADPARIPFSRPPDDPTVTYAEVSYPLADRPRHLTFRPPMKKSGYPAVTIGFIAFHGQVPIIDFRFLSGPEPLDLDWRDPWYSSFRNPNLNRHHRDALMSFLYVEPHEVRHEVLLRIKDLATWMDLGVRTDADAGPGEIASLKARIGDFLLARNALRIDGRAIRPILDRVNFVAVGLSGIQVVEDPPRLDPSAAIVGVVIAYITEGIPAEITVDWDLFNGRIDEVSNTTIDPAGPFTTRLTRQDHVLVWRNLLKGYRDPTVAPVSVQTPGAADAWMFAVLATVGAAGLCATIVAFRRRRRRLAWLLAAAVGASIAIAFHALPAMRAHDGGRGPRAAAEGRLIVEAVLRNIYRAFEFRHEEDVYDKLALSVSGDLLTQIYLQNRRSMVIDNLGGIEARVTEVALESLVPAGDRGSGIAVRCVWTATGTVGHWGHIHQRRNRYDAFLNLEARDGFWKLTGMELVDETRLADRAPARMRADT